MIILVGQDDGTVQDRKTNEFKCSQDAAHQDDTRMIGRMMARMIRRKPASTNFNSALKTSIILPAQDDWPKKQHDILLLSAIILT